MQIIDSQVHIWAADTPERPWAPNMEGRAHLAEPLTAEALLAMMDEAGVDGAVLVPPSLEGDRNDLALAAAAKYPDRFAVMGRLDFTKPQAREALPVWRGQPGMLGIRLTFHRDDTRAQLTDGSADWLWAAAEAHRIPLMVHAPERLGKLAEIAERHPGLTLIVDHMGFARETMDAGAPAGAARVAALSRYPNVHVKVSALPCFSSEPYPFRNLNEPLRRVIDAFGPRRCFWGTDLSRMLAHCTYRQGVTHFTEELTFLSADDLDLIMGRGLRECLRWNLQASTRR
ncbi:MAG TPA: amidohydrolase family protein [Xanthobacteraceae bacterium]|nr:amidohydrolase family protein [Xanthobacteraceae bacterium]